MCITCFSLAKPIIVEEGLEKDLTVETGEPLDLPCPIQGNPRPKVVWSQNGHPVNLNSPEYTMLVSTGWPRKKWIVGKSGKNDHQNLNFQIKFFVKNWKGHLM